MTELWASPTICNGRYKGFVLVSNAGRVKIRQGQKWKIKRTRTNGSGYTIVEIAGRIHYVSTLMTGIDWRTPVVPSPLITGSPRRTGAVPRTVAPSQ